MTLGLLFPGQGTQHAEMLRWLDARPGTQVKAIVERFGADWRARMSDEHWATSNAVAQPLIVAASLAAWGAVRDALPRPAIVAGYSVGELAAVAAANVVDDADAVAFAETRAAAMDRCVPPRTTGLLSITGAPRPAVEHWCAANEDAEGHRAWVAIRIAFDQHIVGGAVDVLDAADAAFTRDGATCRRIAISLASHTPTMAPAVDALRRALDALSLRMAAIPIACDAFGRAERNVDAIREALSIQIARTVLWDDCLDTVRERGVRCVLEVGPGTSLSRMWQARCPDVPARSLDEFREAGSAIDWVLRTLA